MRLLSSLFTGVVSTNLVSEGHTYTYARNMCVVLEGRVVAAVRAACMASSQAGYERADVHQKCVDRRWTVF